RYVLRLQEKYGVFVRFPKASNREAGDTAERDENEDADTVIVKGGKKGVQAAKQELLELMEYEVNSNSLFAATSANFSSPKSFNVEEFTIPARHLPHVVGRSGAKVTEIKDEFDVRVDLGRPEDGAGEDAPVSVRIEGSKSGITRAKSAILAITKEQESTVEKHIHVDPKYHRYLIGSAGSRIRDIVSQCVAAVDASPDPSVNASVHFPRGGADPDKVTIKGDAAVVDKVIEEINRLAAEQANKVTISVSLPVADVPAILGAGGSTLRKIQNDHNVEIFIPKARGNRRRGAVDPDATVAVTVTGFSDNCERAKETLLSKCRVTRSVSVPVKHHRALVGAGGRLLRRLRSELNVTVDYPKRSASSQSPTVPDSGKRIDDEEDAVEPVEKEEEGEVTWFLRGESTSVDKACDIVAKSIEDLVRFHPAIPGSGGFPPRPLFGGK
ncbi:MAG: hypothetical protein BJ554DRAFT_4920, partial [Olpidium bornovanus]